MLTTLRSRIIALYLGLAVLPMIIVGAGSYFQSLRSLTALVEGKLQSLSDQTAVEIADRQRDIGASLRLLAMTEFGEQAGRGVLDARLPAYLGPSLQRAFVTIDFESADGTRQRVFASSEAFETESACLPKGLAAVRAPLSAAGPGVALVGYTPIARLLQETSLGVRLGRTGQTLIIDRASGQVIFDGRCLTGEAVPSGQGQFLADLQRAGPGSLIRSEEGGRMMTGAAAPVAEQPYDVIAAVDMSEFTRPYGQAQILYLSLVLLIVAAAGSAFLLLVGRFLQSLAQLTAAAEQIGDGDLAPWLPPPGDDEAGKLSSAFATMLGRLKSMMRQNEEARQMAVVGQLASQLSHEIRNPLSSIRLNLQSLDREVRAGSVPVDLPAVLRVCLREISRLNDAVTSVLDFGRPRSIERKACRIERLLDEALDLLEPRLQRQGIRVDRREAGGPDHVVGDPAELSGALLNLLINAIDAMPEGGDLRVETRHVEGEVRVHIADSGPGVKPELRELVFQPFFTTKPTGSGIGLSLASQVIRAHGGRLYFEKGSEIEPGAEFVVALPIREGDERRTLETGRPRWRSRRSQSAAAAAETEDRAIPAVETSEVTS